MVAAHDVSGGVGVTGNSGESPALNGNSNAKGSAYGELGEIHALLGNFEQAISCMEHQLTAAR